MADLPAAPQASGDEDLHARVLRLMREAAEAAEPGSGHARFLTAFQGPMEDFLALSARLERSNRDLMAQVAELRAELEHKRRLAALGEMAAGVAHEIRNPLGGIELYAGLLARELASSPDRLRLAQQIQEGARRLNALVEELLTYTRDMRPVARSCRVSDLVDSSAKFVLGLEVVLDLPDPEARLRVDPDLFVRVLVNLFENARQAQAQTSGGQIAGKPCRVHVALRTEGPAAMLSVADEGPGIPEAVMSKLFDPFFTTRATGVGLGLAIVKRIVEAHGGEVHAGNMAGGGAVFHVLLPDAYVGGA